MSNRTRMSMLVVAIAVLGLGSQGQLQAAVSWAENPHSIQYQSGLSYETSPFLEPVAVQESTRLAARGDIATGAVLETRGTELRLNIRPCEATPSVVIFRQPYSRTIRGQKNCAGQNVTIEQIQQN